MIKITIGSRGSKLSKAYSFKVKELLIEKNIELKEEDIELRTITTSGDLNQNIKISEIGGKNLFCKELEQSLLNKEIDIAVHSLKDMESIENKDLTIGAYLKRNDFRDAIVSNKIKKIFDLKKKVIIGSSSKRRELQLKKINKEISIVHIRGNVDTRIKMLEKGNLDGIILAAAGIKCLNMNNHIGLIFESEEILPALGQGIIAAQCRKNDLKILKLLKKINDHKTNLCALAERSLLKTIAGDCHTAIGGLATIENDSLKLKAQLFSDDGIESFEYEIVGKELDASQIGQRVGTKLLNLAGKKFKKK